MRRQFGSSGTMQRSSKPAFGVASAALGLAALLVCIPADAQQASQPVPAPTGNMQMAAQAGQAAPPRCDANCVRANAPKAADVCAPRIEAEAPSDFDWLTRPNPGIFQQADPSSPSDAVVHFRGDSIRFMMADKSWVRVSYECGYDVGSQSVVYVRVRAGRLDQPLQAVVPQSRQPANSPQLAPPRRTQPGAIIRTRPATAMAPAAPPATVVPRRKKPHVWEPSPVEIEQETANSKQRP